MVRNYHLAATLPQPSAKRLREWFPLQVKQAGKLQPIFIVVQIEVRWLHAEAGEKSSHHLFHFGKRGRVCTCVSVTVPKGRGRRRTTALPVATDLPAALTWLLCFEGEPQKKKKGDAFFKTPHISAAGTWQFTSRLLHTNCKEETHRQKNPKKPTTPRISPMNGAGSTSQLAELRNTWW